MKELIQKRAFTLVELLVVISIIAVIATGVAVSYGNIQQRARRQTSLHEMFQIKEAFLQFYNDNYSALHHSLTNHAGLALPDSMTFAVAHTNTIPHDGLMDFFETYGLWFLMQPDVQNANANFLNFGTYDALRGQGWNGPYIDAPVRRTSWTMSTAPTNAVFPQIDDKFGTPYRMLYYEHDEGAPDPIIRRLLLIGSLGHPDRDELSELMDVAGNLRVAANDEGALNLETGAMTLEGKTAYEEDFYIVELLNMDQRR